MKLAILSRKASLYSTSRLKEAGQKRGPAQQRVEREANQRGRGEGDGPGRPRPGGPGPSILCHWLEGTLQRGRIGIP